MNEFRWEKAWGSTLFRMQFFISAASILGLVLVFPQFFDFIEGRGGPRLKDVLMDALPKADVAWWVFGIEYSALALGIYSISKMPLRFLIAMQTYVMVTLLRMLSITLFPLDPPADYISMREPIVQLFTHDSKIISKDLFFSGHVATICVVLFAVTNKMHRYVISIAIIFVSILMMVQRNHYALDLIAAPFFTYGCYVISKNIFVKKCLE